MKKLAALLCLSALTTGAFAQGIVNFANSATTHVTSGAAGAGVDISGAAGSYYFGLLISAPGANTWVNTGITATNSAAAAGRFVLNGVAIPGWGAGVNKDYRVAGWSASLGTTFNNAWLPNGATTGNGFFGFSAIGTGAAGGTDANGNSLPPFPLFGGSGITSGFNLAPVVTPEPSSMALAGLGAAALLIFRRRK
jgi:hypothetical protein